MSIRTKIFFGCISLTFVTILVGVLSQGAQRQLSDTALGIYDNAFISMSYLRSAQSILLSVSRDIAVGEKDNGAFVDELQSALDALDVARERAMSPRGEDRAMRLQVAVSNLKAQLERAAEPPARLQFKAVEQQFDVAVQIYAGDGFRLRRSVEDLARRTRLQTYAAIVGSVITAFIITLMLSRAIVPSIRHAVRIATAIAGGQLDTRIERRRGPTETGILLDALATMQGSIAEKIGRIEALMAVQATSHAAEIASQHARFKAALNNMTLGLCMFDESNGLLVQNRRFAEMFGPEAVAADIARDLPRLRLGGPAQTNHGDAPSRSFNCLLDDGRTIAVAEEAMEGGGRVVTYEDITERQRAEARLAYMAQHDALTGLPNRVLFREQLEIGRQQVRRGGVLTVLCLDLDRFKTVNDTLGHPIGDALLRETAVRLRNAADPADTVVRLGGDEFAVIRYLPHGGPDDALTLADRLIGVFDLPFDIDGHHICIATSIGIAATADGTETSDELLKNADLALYRAKADGRGTYRFFETDMDTQVQAKRLLEIDLRAAIAEGQFELFYQPLVSAKTGAVVAFEALIRWHHPGRGLVPPAAFIPLAEETGLIATIGLWVLNQACRDAVAWPNDVKVAVNLSPLQFRSPDLVGDVAAALGRSGLPATRLELEITESLMLQDTDATLAILHDLRALGLRISMDDFGTGYSSLSYLRRFPFDKIKIDRSFIVNMDHGGDGLAIVSSVINLGRALRMNVVAEGVETYAQMSLLCEAGCQEMQGYLFSRPHPAMVVHDTIERFSMARVA